MVGREVLFSDVYVSFPLVIVAGEKYGTVRDLSQLNGKRVAAGQSYTSYHYIEDNFPEIELVGTSDVADGLLLLTKGQVDAFVGHLAVVVEHMNMLGVENLKIVGTARFKFEHRIGVSPEYPQALSIINKTLAAISENSHREIRKNGLTFAMNSLWTILRSCSFLRLWRLLLPQSFFGTVNCLG